jgi:cation transport ATPase
MSAFHTPRDRRYRSGGKQVDGFAEIRALSQNTLRLIRSNFGVAAGVNSVILAGAASGNLAPVARAILHNGTTIAVPLRALFAVR